MTLHEWLEQCRRTVRSWHRTVKHREAVSWTWLCMSDWNSAGGWYVAGIEQWSIAKRSVGRDSASTCCCVIYIHISLTTSRWSSGRKFRTQRLLVLQRDVSTLCWWSGREIIAARCYASAAYVVVRCLSVCPSDTFVSCIKTNKHMIKIFPPSGSHAILVFLCQMAWQYSDGNPPNRGVECRWGRQKSRFWAYIWLDCLC